MLSGRIRSLLGLIALAMLGCALAWASVPPLQRLLRGASVDFQTAIASCSAGVAWLMLAWFAGCVLLTVLARLPGAAGRCAERTASSITPNVVRRMVQAALGASIVAGTTGQLAYAAAPAQHPASVAATRAAGARNLPLPDRPTPHGAHSPKPDRPGDHGDRHRQHGDHAVVVHRGDTLWGIAASQLSGPATNQRIATAWPHWYAANRSVLGPDPNLILPGQRLQPPTSP